MALQLTLSDRESSRRDPFAAVLAAGYAVLRAVGSGLGALALPRAAGAAAPSIVPAVPALSPPVRISRLPRAQKSLDTQLRTLASVVEQRQQHIERAVVQHRRAAQMVGSIDYEFQCLMRDLNGVLSARPQQRSSAPRG